MRRSFHERPSDFSLRMFPRGGVARSQRCLGSLTVGIEFAVASFDEAENPLETRGDVLSVAVGKGGVVGIDFHEVFELGAWGLGRGGKTRSGCNWFCEPGRGSFEEPLPEGCVLVCGGCPHRLDHARNEGGVRALFLDRRWAGP